MRVALYQPDIPMNLGSIIRLCVCFDTPLSLIEPAGFPLDDKRIRRAALDYADHVGITRHTSWSAFRDWQPPQCRLILLTTKASIPLYDFEFNTDDILLFGQESCGAPEEVHQAASARIRIPIAARSLNLAQAAAITLAEAVRQTNLFPTNTCHSERSEESLQRSFAHAQDDNG